LAPSMRRDMHGNKFR